MCKRGSVLSFSTLIQFDNGQECLQIIINWFTITFSNLYKLCAVWRRMFITEGQTISTGMGVQYGQECAVLICHIISTEEAHVQCRRVCCTEEAHHEYGRRYAVQISGINSMDKGVQYKTTKLLRRLLVVVFIWETDLLQTIQSSLEVCQEMFEPFFGFCDNFSAKHHTHTIQTPS